MSRKLSADEIARYEHDGLLFPVDVFTRAEARHYLACLEGFEKGLGQEFGKGHNFKPHLLFTWADCLSQTRLTAMLVRGVDYCDHFDDEPRPQSDYGAAESAFHVEAVARFRESNREQALRYEAA